MPPRPTHTEAHTLQVPAAGEQRPATVQQTKSLGVLRKQLQKVVLAYGWVSRGVGSGDHFKKEVDMVSVSLIARLTRHEGLTDSADVRKVRELFERLDVLVKALVVAGHVKGHLYAFVRDVGRNVLNKIHVRVETDARTVPALADVFSGEPSRTALSTGGDVYGMYHGVEAIFAEEDAAEDAAKSPHGSAYFVPTPRTESLANSEGSTVGRSHIAKVEASVRGTRPEATRRHKVQAVARPRQGGSSAGRSDEVYAFIKKTGTVGIPAVAAAFPHVSSKTVQRALVALVAAGKLTKAGDRRWTQYTAV